MAPTGTSIDLSPTLIVEDNVVMQQRLHRLLTGLIGGDARITAVSSISAAQAHLGENAKGMAVIDIGLPDGSGIDLIAWLQVHCPQITSVVISAWGDEDTVLAALRAGAIGYLLKEREDAELIQSLQSIRRGGAPIDPNIARRILALLKISIEPTGTARVGNEWEDRAENQLSNRESEILQLVARGFSNREIGELTTLSRFTIEGYTKSIYRKLAVRSRTAAVFEAKALGLLP